MAGDANLDQSTAELMCESKMEANFLQSSQISSLYSQNVASVTAAPLITSTLSLISACEQLITPHN